MLFLWQSWHAAPITSAHGLIGASVAVLRAQVARNGKLISLATCTALEAGQKQRDALLARPSDVGLWDGRTVTRLTAAQLFAVLDLLEQLPWPSAALPQYDFFDTVWEQPVMSTIPDAVPRQIEGEQPPTVALVDSAVLGELYQRVLAIITPQPDVPASKRAATKKPKPAAAAGTPGGATPRAGGSGSAQQQQSAATAKRQAFFALVSGKRAPAQATAAADYDEASAEAIDLLSEEDEAEDPILRRNVVPAEPAVAAGRINGMDDKPQQATSLWDQYAAKGLPPGTKHVSGTTRRRWPGSVVLLARMLLHCSQPTVCGSFADRVGVAGGGEERQGVFPDHQHRRRPRERDERQAAPGRGRRPLHQARQALVQGERRRYAVHPAGEGWVHQRCVGGLLVRGVGGWMVDWSVFWMVCEQVCASRTVWELRDIAWKCLRRMHADLVQEPPSWWRHSSARPRPRSAPCSASPP